VDQLEIGMFRSHYMQFSCYTAMIDLCRLVVLVYVIIDEFSCANCNENSFSPILMNEIVKNT